MQQLGTATDGLEGAGMAMASSILKPGHGVMAAMVMGPGTGSQQARRAITRLKRLIGHKGREDDRRMRWNPEHCVVEQTVEIERVEGQQGQQGERV